jgi:hypothetical protein
MEQFPLSNPSNLGLIFDGVEVDALHELAFVYWQLNQGKKTEAQRLASSLLKLTDGRVE